MKFKPLEEFLSENIEPLELADFLNELVCDYGMMYIYLNSQCKGDDYLLPDDISRMLSYIKELSFVLKECTKCNSNNEESDNH